MNETINSEKSGDMRRNAEGNSVYKERESVR